MSMNPEDLRIEWVRQQKEIAQRVSLRNELPSLDHLKTVAGADVSMDKYSTVGHAGIVVLSYPEMKTIDRVSFSGELEQPYIPTFLSFREWPLLRHCIDDLKVIPDVLICDGQGIAHPRRAGIATHIGVLTGLIAIGCGKTRLCGTYVEPGPNKGSVSDLTYYGEKIGEVVRTKNKTNPLFISPGHRIDFTHATELIQALCGKYRLPEPIRHAHSFVNEVRKAALGNG